MNYKKFENKNFYVCKISAAETQILQIMPLLFDDLEYKEQGAYFILYKHGLFYKELANLFLSSFIELKTKELESIDKIREELLSKVSNEDKSIVNEIFGNQRTLCLEEMIMMEHSMYEYDSVDLLTNMKL